MILRAGRNVLNVICAVACVFALWGFDAGRGSLHAQDMLFLSFGNGKAVVRLYTDYECGPCRALEPQLEPLLLDLVKRNVINLTFIDAPFHKFSSLYTQYFLYVLNEKKEFGSIVSARAVLFEAAKQNITEKEKLEEYLQKKGIRFKPFDVRPAFNLMASYIRDDRINATPTCVIYHGSKKESYQGAVDITKALSALK
jgi:thiol-disulfide isomerase/thioredoxin